MARFAHSFAVAATGVAGFIKETMSRDLQFVRRDGVGGASVSTVCNGRYDYDPSATGDISVGNASFSQIIPPEECIEFNLGGGDVNIKNDDTDEYPFSGIIGNGYGYYYWEVDGFFPIAFRIDLETSFTEGVRILNPLLAPSPPARMEFVDVCDGGASNTIEELKSNEPLNMNAG